MFFNRNNLVTLSPLDEYNSRFYVSHSVYDSHNEVGSSKLQLTNVQKEDYHTYRCIAQNSVGIVEHRITLEGCGKGSYFAAKDRIACLLSSCHRTLILVQTSLTEILYMFIDILLFSNFCFMNVFMKKSLDP